MSTHFDGPLVNIFTVHTSLWTYQTYNCVVVANIQEDNPSQNKQIRRTTRVTSHLPRIVQEAYEAVANGATPQTARPAGNPSLPRPSKSATRARALEQSPPRPQELHPAEFGLTSVPVNKQQQQQQHGIKGKQMVNVRDILTNAIRENDPVRAVSYHYCLLIPGTITL